MAKRRFLTTSGTGPGAAAIGGAPETDPEELRRHVARNRLNRARRQAKDGEPDAFIELLADPTIEKTQHDCRLAAELLRGMHKRTKGGQAKRDLALKRAWCLSLAVVLEHHLGIAEKVATEDLATFFRVGKGTIREWKRDRRKEIGPEHLAELIDHAGEAYEWWVADFLSDDLRRLFRLTGE